MILHITNDYSGSTVYKNLVDQLDKKEISQIVYNPIRESGRINKNKIEFIQKESKIIYSHILNSHTDRIFYKKKIYKIVKDIERKVDLSKITFIHAHTWYSDGGVAYLLHKKYHIPYMVAVRNTDINVFQKYFVHERFFGKEILACATRIITISSVYKNRLLKDKRLITINHLLNKKLVVIPNGVDPYWLINVNTFKKEEQNLNNFNLLYVGKFDKGKNVLNLVRAVKKFNQDNNLKCKLSLVGGGGSDEQSILREINGDANFSFLGQINDKDKLLVIYRNHHIFLMPSRAETFGLVYVEAMLQGLPILYTNNEGIDGSYSDNIGEKVYSFDTIEIYSKIKLLIQNFNNYRIPYDKLLYNHNWRNIASIYQEIYNEQK